MYEHVHVDVHVLHGRLIHPMHKLYKHVHVDVHVLHGRLIHPMYKLYKHLHVDVHVLHGRLIHPMHKLCPQSVCIYGILRPSETLTSSNRLPHTLSVGRNTFTPPPPKNPLLLSIPSVVFLFLKGISIDVRVLQHHLAIFSWEPFSLAESGNYRF